MFEVELLPSALKDLTQAVAYIKDTLDNHQAAADLARDFYIAITNLKDNPYTHALYSLRVPNLGHEYRRVNVRNYAIFYWVEEPASRVVVSRMIYARRDFLRIQYF